MRILIVKLSSLGDVVHAMPAVSDIRAAFPRAQIDWVVERGFAPLVVRCSAVNRVIVSNERRWRHALLSRDTWAEWSAFKSQLRETPYDAVIDLQGLIKSALVARLAELAPGGKRFAMGNATEGSSYEAMTRWVADVAIELPTHIHAIDRARQVCAGALGYTAQGPWKFGLLALGGIQKLATKNRANAAKRPVGGPMPVSAGGAPSGSRGQVALVHGTSRDDKLWPESHWLELAQRLFAQGFTVALPHGSAAELERAQRLQTVLGERAEVWGALGLDALTDALGACAGVVGVDSGLSHIATALDLPHVQIYNHDTAWRTGPQPGARRQRAVFASPTPAVDVVWQAWSEVIGA